jgi:hypothetical protein
MIIGPSFYSFNFQNKQTNLKSTIINDITSKIIQIIFCSLITTHRLSFYAHMSAFPFFHIKVPNLAFGHIHVVRFAFNVVKY